MHKIRFQLSADGSNTFCDIIVQVDRTQSEISLTSMNSTCSLWYGDNVDEDCDDSDDTADDDDDVIVIKMMMKLKVSSYFSRAL